MKSLLIFGSITDPHVERVASRLIEESFNVYFFDLDADISAHASVNHAGQIDIKLKAINFNNGEITSLPQDGLVA